MKRKISLIFVAAFCLLLAVISARQPETAQKTPPEELAKIEGALGEEWKKQSQTIIVPAYFSDSKGNSIVFYACQTSFYDAEPPVLSGLDPVLNEVIDPETAESSRACQVSGLDAMRYEKEGRAFLCWTVSPEYSCAIEYDPDAVTDADIAKMAESVPRNRQDHE